MANDPLVDRKAKIVSGELKVGDRMRISWELVREAVVEEILRRDFPAFRSAYRLLRVEKVEVDWDDVKVLWLSTVDESGKPLDGWKRHNGE